MALKKITLYGGFHNSPAINIALAPAVIDRLKSGEASLTDRHVLSRAQQVKLQSHFCGIKGCTCGSYSRANIDFND